MNYYVNGEVGSDSNDGLSWENAFATINHAISIADRQRNDIVYILGDNEDGSQQVYDEKIELSAGNLACILDVNTDNYEYELSGYYIKLIGIGVNKPKTNPTVPVNEGRANTLSSNYNGMWFENIDFSNETSETSYVFEITNSQFTVYKNCIFNCFGGGGLYIWNYAGNIMIDSCTFKTNGISTRIIRFYIGKGRPVYIKNCTVENEGVSYDMECATGFEEVHFYNNEIISSDFVMYGAENWVWQEEVNSISDFRSYVNKLIFKNSIFRDKLTLNTRNLDKYIEKMKNVTYLADELDISADWLFENCVLWGDTDLTINRLDFARTGKLIFRNCILRNNPETVFPDDIIVVENCLIGVDPQLDINGEPTADSPCLPENWTGSEPIESFVGWKNYYEEPTFSMLSTDGESDYIPILFYAQGSESFVPNIEYSLDNGSTWNPCTIIFDNDKELVPNNMNAFLWNSKSDISTDESVKIRVYGNDGQNDSNVIEGTFNVFNAPKVLINPVVDEVETYDFKGDIEIGFTAFDDSSILSGEVEYYDSGSWYSCTLKYNDGNKFVASDLGERNTILWDSESDISTELTTKIRIKTTDIDDLDSGWVESGLFLVDNDYIPAVISDISFDSTSEDITISYNVQDDDYSILQTEVQYYDENEDNWYSCTLKYMNEPYSVASESGENNIILWDSFTDIPEDMNTEIRIRVNDGHWTEWESSGTINILNGTLPPKPIAIEKIKAQFKETEKLNAKIIVI